LALASPATLRANSITAICMPKQMPKYGTLPSRANLTAAILPSVPRSPKPPGDQDAADVGQVGGRALGLDVLGVDVDDLDRRVVGDAAVEERLVQALVALGEVARTCRRRRC
jgi:hypothetical protein